MMRVAGRDSNGLAKGVKVSSDGSLEVQTPSKLLKEYIADIRLISNFAVVFGETTSASKAASVRPILTPFTEKIIWIKNNHDATINLDYIYLHDKDDTNSNYKSIDVNIDIEAGQSLEITSDQVKRLAKPSIGISFRIQAPNVTTGTVDIKVFGGGGSNGGASGNSIQGADVQNPNKTLSATFVDDNGLGVLRTVDAAPFAYDETDDNLKVKFEKGVRKQKEIILARESRDNGTHTFPTVIAPKWAKGYIVELDIYSLIGDFSESDGIRLQWNIRTGDDSNAFAQIQTEYTKTAKRAQVLHCYPGISGLGDLVLPGAQFVAIPTLLGEKSTGDVTISAPSDGMIDCELAITWLD